MKVSCPSCQTNYKIDDKRIPPGGAKLKCAKCQTTFPIKADVESAVVPAATEAIPLPGMAAPRRSAVPLPGITAAVAAPATNLPSDNPRWDEESTRVASVQVPDAAYGPGENATRIEQMPADPNGFGSSQAVPLPGYGQPQASGYDEPPPAPAYDAAPPEPAYDVAPPEPAYDVAPPAYDEAPQSSGYGDAVPLPEIDAPAYDQAPQSAGFGDAVPLPGIDAPAYDQAPQSSGYGDAVPLPGMDAPAYDSAPPAYDEAPPADGYGDAVPLPGVGAPALAMSAEPYSVPLPAPARRTVAMPGITAAVAAPASNLPPEEGARWDEESTRVQSLPIPEDAFAAPPQDGGAVPLPGAGWDSGPAEGDAAPEPAGIDFADADLLDAPSSAPTQSLKAVPLPGGARAVAPESDPYKASIPLPGSSRAAAPPPDPYKASIPLPGMRRAASAAPTPQVSRAAPMPSGEDFAEQATSVVSAPKAPAPKRPEFDFADLPSPAGAPSPAPANSFDFADLPSPAGAPAPRQANSFDFGDLPSPASAAPPGGFDLAGPEAPPPSGPPPGSFDFGDLPAPAQTAPPPSFELDLGSMPNPPGAPPAMADLPSPGQAAPVEDFAVDFNSPPNPRAAAPAPQPSPPPADFGDVDLGGPPSSGDGLEFDPSAPAAGAADDLEADLSAPMPASSSSSNADGLEMLDFIDSAAKDAKAGPAPAKAKRFHVRRRSGKVFGPFDEGVVVKMLEDGQLLGNEDASTDGDTWAAIGTVPAFGEVIQRLMQSPSRAMTSVGPASDASRQSSESAKTMDRLKDLYEGRMAAVAVVDSSATAAAFRRKIPFVVGAVLVVLILATGGTLATTKYGFFGIKALLPSKVSTGSGAYNDLQKAQKALLSDTYKSYQEARDAAASALKVKEYPEARAVWCQAIFYLKRRYSSATPAEVAKAEESLEDIQLLGKKNVEVVKALAGGALAANNADEALALLEDAFARTDNQADVELAFLRAEAYAKKGQTKLATEGLKKVLEKNKGSAKALHALGNLYQAGKDADSAAKAYEEALAADPNHVVSALELGAIELLIRKEAEKGAAVVEQALTEERRPLLGPAELARGLALKGESLTMQFKLKEATAQFEQALKIDPTSLYAKAGLGKAYLAQRQYADAVPLFKAATERDPTDLIYTDGYLTALIATGKMDDAFKQLESANARFPGNGRIAFLAGRVNDSLDLTKEAESNYVRAISADPKLFEANLHLGRMYLRMKRLTEARPHLDAALAKAPNDASVHTGVGELAVIEGDLAKAKAEFDLAIGKDPNLADAHLGLSRVALAAGDLPTAGAEVDKALELDTHLKEGRLERGLVFWKQKRLDESIVELEKAKAEDPKSAKILVTLGAVKLDKEDLGGAETNLLAALSQEPSNAEAHYYVARVRSKRLEHTQAIESMKAALERAPKRADFHYWMGLIYRDAKRSQEAVAEWKETIDLDPNYADALEALGQAFLEKGEFDAAVNYYDLALKADPARTRVMAQIGDCYYQAAKWNEAIARYQKALKVDPGLKQVYYKVARAYTEKGQHADAVVWYKKATSLDPDAPLPYLYLGYAFKERGEKRDAITAFRAYLERKPDAEDKKEVEDEIYDLEH